jgi:cytochrome b pre-mRNA-processing protein 3
MVFSFGRQRPSPTRLLLDRLHTEIVAATRRPDFYIDYGVPDTFEGRFEMLALHAGLVLRRLNQAEAPGPAVAQDLVDTIFARLDADLREAGVGDITVPKRMKKLCEAFLGRSAAYDAALPQGPEALTAAVSRNIYAGTRDGTASRRMADYVATAAAALAATPLAACLAEPLPLPDPSSIPSRSFS